MKNILVFHSHNYATHYLSEHALTGTNACDWDSCDISWGNNYEESRVREGMQTKDGAIQFFRFKRKEPRIDGSDIITENHLEYWVDKLKTELEARGETLDAIVLPNFETIGSPSKLRYLKELKELFPNVLIVADNPTVPVLSAELAEKLGSLVSIPEKQKMGFEPRLIRQGDPEFQLAAPIDLVIQNVSGIASVNALRAELKLPEQVAIDRTWRR